MASDNSNNVTVTDIARQAGVSQATVSAALHGRGRVGEERRKQIIAIAKSLGYQPRLAAQLLRARQTSQLGIVAAAQDSVQAFNLEVQRDVIGHFVQACTENGTRYVIEFHHHRLETENKFALPSQITAKLVDGTILVGDVGDQLRQWLADRADFPWISIEEPAPLCVLSAANEGTSAAVRRLAELGHRHIAYAGGPERYSQHRLGQQGFLKTCQACGIATEVQLFACALDAAEARAAVAWARTLLAAPGRPTAVVCHGESFARAVVHAAAEAGLRIPQDLSVVSYGSGEEACRRYPHLTTLENDYATITREALRMLRMRIRGDMPEQRQRYVKPQLVEGATIGPAPSVF